MDGDTLGPFSWSSPAGGVWTLEGADAHGVPILGPNQQKCGVFFVCGGVLQKVVLIFLHDSYSKWYLSISQKVVPIY